MERTQASFRQTPTEDLTVSELIALEATELGQRWPRHGDNFWVTIEKCRRQRNASALSAPKRPGSGPQTGSVLSDSCETLAFLAFAFRSICERMTDFFLFLRFLLRSPRGRSMHETFRYTICNQLLVPQTSCAENAFMTLGRCPKRETGERSLFFFFSYLAFVEVVDDLLVELLLQLPLCGRLVPVPLREVGRTHVLRPLRAKQGMSGRVRVTVCPPSGWQLGCARGCGSGDIWGWLGLTMRAGPPCGGPERMEDQREAKLGLDSHRRESWQVFWKAPREPWGELRTRCSCVPRASQVLASVLCCSTLRLTAKRAQGPTSKS